MTDIEHRALAGAEVRATGGNTIVFRPIVFDARSQDLGGFQEIIRPGAVTQTLRDRAAIVADFAHESAAVLGSTQSGTLRLQADARGVLATVDMPATTTGRDVLELVKRGDIAGASFAFRSVRDHWDERGGALPVRIVDELDLLAVSLVASPAYLQTIGTVSARALDHARGLTHRQEPQTPHEMAQRLEELRGDYDYDEDKRHAIPPLWVTHR